MNNDICEPVPPRQSTIGLVAYCALPPDMVFVRIPNERGRWMITHICVVKVRCEACNAAVGEPCRNESTMRYHTGTHCKRRSDWQRVKRRDNVGRPKPHLSTNDLSDAMAILI